MIHGITKIACTCMCACDFPDRETCSRGREDSMDYTHAVEALFDTEIEAIRWAAATRQRKAYQLNVNFQTLGKEVHRNAQGWLATISWNE